MYASYSLRVVLEYLKSKNIEYTVSNASVGLGFYDHGCRIQLNDRYKLSIQTHPDVAVDAFAETAIVDTTKRGPVYGVFGYDDVLRHRTPEDLFAHIEEVLEKAKANTTTP